MSSLRGKPDNTTLWTTMRSGVQGNAAKAGKNYFCLLPPPHHDTYQLAAKRPLIDTVYLQCSYLHNYTD